MDEPLEHTKCLHESDWAMVIERFSNFEKTFHKYTVAQTELNTSQTAILNRLMHKIYGNATDGLDTTMKLNKQASDSSIILIQASITRLWWMMGVIAMALLGNLVKLLFF